LASNNYSPEDSQPQDDNHDTGDMDNVPDQGHSLLLLHAQLAQNNTTASTTDEAEEPTSAINTTNEAVPDVTNGEQEGSSSATTSQQPPAHCLVKRLLHMTSRTMTMTNNPFD
jgi:hypothetical protein